MTLWELCAAIDGYIRVHAAEGGSPEPPTDEEFEQAKRDHGDE